MIVAMIKKKQEKREREKTRKEKIYF